MRNHLRGHEQRFDTIWREGRLSITQIADMFGMAKATVNETRIKRGLPPRDLCKPKTERNP